MVKAYHYLLLILLLGFSSSQIFSQITIQYSDDMGNQGENVTIDVTVNGFTNVRNFNFVTEWDPTMLEYVSMGNINAALPISDFTFGTPDITNKPDRLTALFSQSGSPVEYTLNSNDVLFSITLRIISSLCTTTEVDTLNGLPKNEFVVFSGGSETKVTPGSNPGDVDINPGCASTNVLSVGDASGLPNSEVCIPIMGTDLVDLAGFSGLEFRFDPTILSYSRFENKTAPFGDPLVGTADAANGILRLQYNYIGSGGVGLTAASEQLFCICFDVVGDCDLASSMTLDEGLGFIIVNSATDPIDYDLESGNFTVNCCDASAEITGVTCPGGNDGAISLTTMGCMNITSITWSNTTQTGASISGLEAGTYDATITFDGGSSTRVITGITVPAKPAIAVQSIQYTQVVNGGDGAIDIEIMGGTPPYSYSWSNGSNQQDISGLDAGDYTLTVTDANNCVQVLGPFTVATAPAVSGVVTNVTCFGTNTGAVDITVTGGASPYTYNWSCAGTVDPVTGDITGLSGGTCTVTVTDAGGFSTTATFEIETPPSALVVSLNSITDDTNNDGNGAIALDVSGGWGGYSYNWDDGSVNQYPSVNPLTDIFGGDYMVTVTDANGCQAVLGPFMVEGLRVLGTSVEPVACFGDNNGAIDIEVLGGSGNYSYSWSCTDGIVDADGNISGLTSGPCTVTVTDLSQNSTTTATFTVPGPSSALVVNVGMECSNADDGSLRANASGGLAPYSYEWNTNPVQTTEEAIGLPVGDYSVLVTDSVGCQVMALATVSGCDELDCYRAMDVITPNNDGKNDLFIIDCANTSNNKLYIYTRWGQDVIEFNNYQNNWDGTDEGGNLVDEDTYMWVLEVTTTGGNTVLYKGAVTVLYKLR